MVCIYTIRSEFWHAFGQKRIKDVQHIRLLFHKLKLFVILPNVRIYYCQWTICQYIYCHPIKCDSLVIVRLKRNISKNIIDCLFRIFSILEKIPNSTHIKFKKNWLGLWSDNNLIDLILQQMPLLDVGPHQVKCQLLILEYLMQWISSIFWKFCNTMKRWRRK